MAVPGAVLFAAAFLAGARLVPVARFPDFLEVAAVFFLVTGVGFLTALRAAFLGDFFAAVRAAVFFAVAFVAGARLGPAARFTDFPAAAAVFFFVTGAAFLRAAVGLVRVLEAVFLAAGALRDALRALVEEAVPRVVRAGRRRVLAVRVPALAGVALRGAVPRGVRVFFAAFRAAMNFSFPPGLTAAA
ncbi:MAG: hypothetical protein DIU54_009805 [Acidobacteriota bacterium]